jgi:hypothetical protein
MNKQEILEQAANEYILHESKSKWAEIIKNAFIEGAKWKAEKMYSEVFEWLSSKDYLTDKVDILKKEFEQNKQV